MLGEYSFAMQLRNVIILSALPTSSPLLSSFIPHEINTYALETVHDLPEPGPDLGLSMQNESARC